MKPPPQVGGVERQALLAEAQCLWFICGCLGGGEAFVMQTALETAGPQVYGALTGHLQTDFTSPTLPA
jgi:hypothetical protein